MDRNEFANAAVLAKQNNFEAIAAREKALHDKAEKFRESIRLAKQISAKASSLIEIAGINDTWKINQGTEPLHKLFRNESNIISLGALDDSKEPNYGFAQLSVAYKQRIGEYHDVPQKRLLRKDIVVNKLITVDEMPEVTGVRLVLFSSPLRTPNQNQMLEIDKAAAGQYVWAKQKRNGRLHYGLEDLTQRPEIPDDKVQMMEYAGLMLDYASEWDMPKLNDSLNLVLSMLNSTEAAQV